MRLDPLQLWDPSIPPEWVVTYIQVTDVLTALLGVVIAYQAYRGYRRNDSRPMLFIAIGFALVLAVPFVLLVAFLVIPGLTETGVSLVSQTSQVLGVAAILYAIRLPR
jgi:hypothetical protein